MSATDELRRMLDERGVEYERTEDDTTIYYDSDGNRYTYNVNPDSGWAQLFGYNLTPEQAIAATLGGGECEFVDDSDGEFPPKCSACGYEPSAYECSWFDDGYVYEGDYCPDCGRKVKR